MIYTFDNKQNVNSIVSKDKLIDAHLVLKINEAATFTFSLTSDNQLSDVDKYIALPHPLNKSVFILLRLTEKVINENTVDYTAHEFAYQELSSDGYIEDKRPASTDGATLMKIALDGSQWELNKVNVAGTAKTNFYYVDHLTAISQVVELLGGEIVFYIQITGNKITGRYMDYLAQQGQDTSKVFSAGSNLLTVTRQEQSDSIYTAILPRGKGEQVSEGEGDTPDGYGRRINISDVEWKKSGGKPLDKAKGSLILADPEANKEWGHVNGNYRLLLKTYDSIDDVNVLINQAYKDLIAVNHPQIQYSATVADVGGLSLGDTVLIMHRKNSMSYKTRVFEVNYDLLNESNTTISLGDNLSSNSITNTINSIATQAGVSSEQTQWTIASINRASVTYGPNPPASAKDGDTWFKTLPNGETEIYTYANGQWMYVISTTDIHVVGDKVDKLIDEMNDQVNKVNDLTKKLDDTTIENALQLKGINELIDSTNKDVAQAKDDIETVNKSLDDQTKELEQTRDDLEKYGLEAEQQGQNIKQLSEVVDGYNLLLADTSRNAFQAVVTSRLLRVAMTNSQKDVSQLSLTANQFKLQFEDIDKNISSLGLTAKKFQVSMRDAENNISDLSLTAKEFKLTFQNQAMDISQLKMSADEMSLLMAKKMDSTEVVSKITASAESLTTDFVKRDADLNTTLTAQIKASADSLIVKYDKVLEGYVTTSDFSIRADKIDSTIQKLDEDTSKRIQENIDALKNYPKITSGDLNDYKTVGDWSVYQTSTSSILNVPSGVNYGILNVQSAYSWVTQELTNVSNGDKWKRKYFNVWSDWERVAIGKDVAEVESHITQLADNINARIVEKGKVVSEINIDTSGVLISGKKIWITGDTVMDNASIKNAAIESITADKITAGTINAAVIKVVNIDVANIVGNISNFVKSYWSDAFKNQVTIDAGGMTVITPNINTLFNALGVNVTVGGKKIGWIGVNGFVGMSDYNGLTFNLDYTGDYMSWAARNSGQENSTPITKLAWFRQERYPSQFSSSGFHFMDEVDFTDKIHGGGGSWIKIQQNPNGGIYIVNGHGTGFALNDNDTIGILKNWKSIELSSVAFPLEIDSTGGVKRWASL